METGREAQFLAGLLVHVGRHYQCTQGGTGGQGIECLHHDVAEFLGGLISAPIFQGILKGILRVLAQCARGGLYVLFIKHGGHIIGHQVVLGHPLRVEPDAHGIVAAHHIDVAHAADA